MLRRTVCVLLTLGVVGWALARPRALSTCSLAILLPVVAGRKRQRDSFAGALDDWLSGAASIDGLATALAGAPIEGPEDVAAVAEFLASFGQADTPVRRVRRCHRALPHVVDSCLAVHDETCSDAIQDRVLPEAAALFEASLGRRSRMSQETALALLELLLGFDEPEVVDRLVRAVRLPLQPDHLDWSRVFSCLDGTHPFWPRIRDALADPLPPSFIAIAFLDAMNNLALSGYLDWHPFASETGCSRLEAWLGASAIDEYSYARSATTALPFVGRGERDRLLPLAQRHPDEEVRLEACWVAAVTGDASGIEGLARWSEDTMWSRQACQYLRELHREDAIPEFARTPEFEGISALTAWLAHPDQLDCRPQRVEVIEQRELFWPPLGEKQLIQLVRYEAEAPDGVQRGVGMVGDYTFALLDHPTEEMSVEDLYGLYCAWEMAYRQVEGAPEELDARAGREILARYNPGFE
jgi:hypothetical protein